MNAYWSKKAASLTPYTAGEQPRQKMIKLNTNENAYPPSPKVAQAVGRALEDLRRYPRPEADAFRSAAARLHGLSDAEILCANGSDEALALSFLAFFDPGRPVRTMDVTYSFYPVWAQLFDLTLEEIPLNPDFTADVAGLCGGENAVVANPNAPTGIALSACELEKIVESTRGVVIVDEAYAGFGAESAIPLVRAHPNLAVVRTLSKSHSLAGLRAGYVAANETLIAALRAVRDSFNSYPVDMLAQAGAAAALADTEYYDGVRERIVNTRAAAAEGLRSLGMEVLPSSANFIFVKCTSPSAQTVYERLREEGILVRYFPKGRTKEYLRVTIGTPEEMRAFLQAMENMICG